MANKLTNLEINRVSYCGRGMNKHARIALYKAVHDDSPKVDSEKSAALFTGANPPATINATRGTSPQGDSTMPEPTTAELTKTIEKMQADIQAVGAILKASPDEKRHMAEMDEEKSKKFMAKSADERAAEIKKAADDALAKAKAEELAKSQDESLTIDGATIRKSENPGLFAIVKAQQAKLDANAGEIAKANERAEIVTLEKRAVEEFPSLPGSPAEKAAVLKAVAAMPEAVAKTATSILTAAEKMAKGAFGTLGTSLDKGTDDADATDAKAVWKTKVSEVEAANPDMAKSAVLSKARESYPAEFKAAHPTTAAAVAKSTAAATGRHAA